MIPGDPVTAHLSQRALNDPDVVAAFRAKYGLDQPYIVQYFYHIRNMLQLDLGTSIRTNTPVLEELLRAFPATIELALFAIVMAAVFGIFFGIISAIKRNSIVDQIVRAISVTGVSIPSFWFALLVMFLLYYKLGWFPGPGRLSIAFSAPAHVTGMYVIDSLLEGSLPKAWDAFMHLVLPGSVLAAFTMGLITRTTRSNLLDVMSMDYIRTARAKGVAGWKVIFKHALKNALNPVITYAGPMMAGILTGSMVVENIFSVPGLGRLFVNSMLRTDYMMIMGVTIFLATLIILMNFLSDVLYKVMDPRIDLS
jgi:peptide/nickel transport system permease protein